MQGLRWAFWFFMESCGIRRTWPRDARYRSFPSVRMTGFRFVVILSAAMLLYLYLIIFVFDPFVVIAAGGVPYSFFQVFMIYYESLGIAEQDYNIIHTIERQHCHWFHSVQAIHSEKLAKGRRFCEQDRPRFFSTGRQRAGQQVR